MENILLDIKKGDKVRVFYIQDDSGNATDIFGVEPHLNGWVDNRYLDVFEGIVDFCNDKLMYVIKYKNKKMPLSPSLRESLNMSKIYESENKKSICDNFLIEKYYLNNIPFEDIFRLIIKL